MCSGADFRKEVKDVLGIPEKYCLDAYGMVEGNGWMVQCPEGHYLHVPYSYYKPIVLVHLAGKFFDNNFIIL